MKRIEEKLKENHPLDLIPGLKSFLEEKRLEIYELHRRGASGKHTVVALTKLVDEVITHLYRETFKQNPIYENIQSQCCLVAVGGYGRKELAPFSDIDLMFLFEPRVKEEFQEIVKGMLYHLWDLKFTLGHSLRTVPNCIEESQKDVTVRTSLMEARLLSGNEFLFRKFRQALYDKFVGSKTDRYAMEKIEERKTNFARYGGTVYLLEPDIKKSEGGLREIHYLQWIALAKYRTCSLPELQQQGYLSVKEFNALAEAQDFLWRIRAEMHFYAGKSSDILTFDEQQRLAERFNFCDQDHQLGVERFMQQYYLYSTRIHEICSRFIERNKNKPKVSKIYNRFFSKTVNGLFVLGKDEIFVKGNKQEKFLTEGKNFLQLFYLAKTHKLRISDETLEMVHHGMEFLKGSFFKTPEVAHFFILIMSEPGGIAKTLRLMHQVSLLEKIIPEFSRVNRLVQFNQYHKFTVDEHSFNAVEQAENLIKEEGNLTHIYSEIKRKDILHLGVLLHDMGKGLGGDHSEKGAEIATSVALRLNYGEPERDLLVFLVRFHLLMTHIAFRRDLSDEKVLIQFARKVAKPEILKKLYVLTCSDIKGVGPGTWNGWKENLLSELFYKTLEALAGTESTLSTHQRIQRIWEEVMKKGVSGFSQEWLEEQRNDMNDRYLLVTPVGKILKDLTRIRQLEPGGVVVDVEERDPSGVVDLSVYTFDNIIPGLFSKISGVLAAKGLHILGAQVHTRKNGIVVDTFQVVDPDYNGKPPPERWSEIGEALKGVLQKKVEIEQLFGKRFSGTEKKPVGALLEPTQVEVDNEASDDYTILEVFAADRQGLLYVITKTIFELGLSVYSSKIGTRLDQIVDVFYVKDAEGKKVVDENKINEIKEKIIKAIEV